MRLIYEDHMGKKRAVNLSLDSDLLDEAKSYGMNLSKTVETVLRSALEEERARAWQSKNAKAVTAWNEWVEENGVPFSSLRPW